MVCTMFGYFSFSNLKAFQGWSIKLKLNWLCLQPPWALALRAMGWNIEFFLLLRFLCVQSTSQPRDGMCVFRAGGWSMAGSPSAKARIQFNSEDRRAALLRRLHAITVRATQQLLAVWIFLLHFAFALLSSSWAALDFDLIKWTLKGIFSLSISISFDWLPPNGAERWKHISIQLRSRTHHYYASSHLHYTSKLCSLSVAYWAHAAHVDRF